jgi:predicted nucleotidyltransferase
VSVQTASRNLRSLVERGFAEETRGGGEGRGYKRFRAREFAHVFAGFDGELVGRAVDVSTTHRALLSVLKVPQEELHSVLLSYLFSPDTDRDDIGITGVVLYGSAARGEADEESDIDLLIVRDPERGEDHYRRMDDPGEVLDTAYIGEHGLVDTGDTRVISEQWYTVTEFREALDAGSQFLRTVLDEGIVLYDPEGVVRDARQGRASERVPP